MEDKELESDFQLEKITRIALDVSRGYTMPQLADKHGMTIREVMAIRKNEEVSRLAMIFSSDYRSAAEYKLLYNADTAVRELVAFLGLPDISPRDELTAIHLILSLALKVSKETTGEIALKGGDRKTIDQIRDTLLRIHS